MLCPLLRFVPPPNFVGSVAFDITLANPTDRPADSILETATVQRSCTTSGAGSGTVPHVQGCRPPHAAAYLLPIVGCAARDHPYKSTQSNALQ